MAVRSLLVGQAKVRANALWPVVNATARCCIAFTLSSAVNRRTVVMEIVVSGSARCCSALTLSSVVKRRADVMKMIDGASQDTLS